MDIINLKEIKHKLDDKLLSLYNKLDKLLKELKDRTLKEKVIVGINNEVRQVNLTLEAEADACKQLKKSYTFIIKLIEKEHKLVPQNYYINIWMPIGMASFGLPIGVAFGLSLGNLAFLGIGLPIGLVIGLAVGTELDKRAYKENRQLDLDHNF